MWNPKHKANKQTKQNQTQTYRYREQRRLGLLGSGRGGLWRRMGEEEGGTQMFSYKINVIGYDTI